MENTIINNNAINSFRKIEDMYFNNLGKEFNASEYISTLIDNCRKDGQMILDFYHEHGKNIILRISYDATGKGMEREPSTFNKVLLVNDGSYI